MNDVEFVDSLINTHKDNYKMIIEMWTASRARVVWSVGLAGFALLNAKPYWDSLAEKPIVGISNVWLSLPWIFSTFLGVITYFLVDETAKTGQLFYASLFNAFEVFKIDLEDEKANVDKLKQINRGEDQSVSESKKGMLIWSKWARWFELFTFASLVAGFIWSAIGPLLLK